MISIQSPIFERVAIIEMLNIDRNEFEKMFAFKENSFSLINT